MWVPGSESSSGDESSDEHVLSFCSFMNIRSVVLHNKSLPDPEKEACAVEVSFAQTI